MLLGTRAATFREPLKAIAWQLPWIRRWRMPLRSWATWHIAGYAWGNAMQPWLRLPAHCACGLRGPWPSRLPKGSRPLWPVQDIHLFIIFYHRFISLFGVRRTGPGTGTHRDVGHRAQSVAVLRFDAAAPVTEAARRHVERLTKATNAARQQCQRLLRLRQLLASLREGRLSVAEGRGR